MGAASILALIGFILIFAGIALIFIALIKFAFKPVGKAEVHGGGVAFFGPFPIIFGTDRKIIETLLIFCIIAFLVIAVCMLVLGIMKIKGI